jgi:thiosulfate/3-mercaptopyruvate sulfurtransferase
LFIVVFCSGILFGSDIKLIEAADAIRLIGNKRALFVSGESNNSYIDHHITGSILMPAHDLYHSDDMGNMRCAPLYDCPKEAEAYIRSKGVKNDQMIIAYDQFQGSDASGIYSYFESFGHADIRILNGGLNGIRLLDPNQQVFDKLKAEQVAIKREAEKAREAGNAEKEKKLKSEAQGIEAKMNMLAANLLIRSGKEEARESSDYKLDVSKINTKHIAEKREIKKAADDILKNGKQSKFAIIDTRSLEEIIGQKKRGQVVRGGHIPGAVFIGCKKITDAKNRKSFKSREEMQKIFDKVGIGKDKTIYVYSHIGVGCASYIAAALRLLGYENVKIFTGGWNVWGNDISLPIRR